MKSAHKIVAWFAGAASLVALVVVPSFSAFRQITEAAAARQRVQLVMSRADDLLSSLIDAETGQRGYLLTGDEAFLEPYLAVRDGIDGQVRNLRLLTTDGAAHERLEALAPLIGLEVASLSRIVELRRNDDIEAALANVRGAQGKRLMDSIRAEMRGFIRIERGVLAQREAALQSNMRSLFIIIVAASLATLLFALSFAYLIHRETQHRLSALVHVETKRFLEAQEETNRQLALANITLQASEEKLAVTLDSIGDAVIATDARGRVTLLNPLAAQLTGWTQEEAAGRPVDEIFHIINRDTRQPSAIPVDETLTNGTVEGLANDAVLIGRDGTERAIADTCAPIRDRDGKVVGAVLVFRDVTEECAAQQASRDSAALIETILNTVVDGIITLHASAGIVETVNPAAERMFGYAAAELIGRDFSLLIPELDRDQRDNSIEYYGASDEARAVGLGREVVGRRKDGSLLPLEIAVSEMYMGGQRYFTGILRDITARKKFEEERMKLDQRLRDQQFYTRSLIESNVDALMTTDPGGIITDVNGQTEGLTGCTRDELIGASFKDYFTDPVRAEAGISRVLHEGKVTDYELTARARNGTLTVVSYNATTFYDRDRRLQGVVAAARDVTELKRFEQALQEKNAELEGASRMKSEFLANMSHELRTPLNAIIGFSEVLRDGLMGELTDQQRRFIGDIFSSGQHLLSLINDILDLSKVEAGKMALDLETVPISSSLGNSLSIIREKAVNRRIHLALEAAEELGSTRVDARKFKQIVYNLLSNAVKFTPEGGQVTLRADRVPRSAVGQPGGFGTGLSLPLADNEFTEFLEIGVTDSGIGISPQGLQQLFKPFSQVDSGLARKFEGTGLGLVMVKLLTELHGGTVAVESAQGAGSTFTVWLPLRAPAQEALASPRPPDTFIRTLAQARTALVVEDDLKSAELIRVHLESEGFEVQHALSGEAALALAVQLPLSLITLDIMLPGMDGWEFLACIRQVPNLKRIPVVIISILADRSKGVSLGAAAVLQKPISRHELYESLVELGLYPLSEGQTLEVLVVDDDPKAVELIAVRLRDLASTVLRAYGGREAIEIARRELPDLIVLDLMMPEVNGFDVVDALNEHPDTAGIPILVVTAKQITDEDRAKLSSQVTAILGKAGLDRDRFTAEVRRAMSLSQRPVAA